ncbi:uncharacterized protein BKA78DRAFT_326943 [Phyllosticta capitalensis]|uniref:uncharacterized protein n=1 Tax=Phyllosticta capitalensis TaxID=121624 RepID=UPI00312D80DE
MRTSALTCQSASVLLPRRMDASRLPADNFLLPACRNDSKLVAAKLPIPGRSAVSAALVARGASHSPKLPDPILCSQRFFSCTIRPFFDRAPTVGLVVFATRHFQFWI